MSLIIIIIAIFILIIELYGAPWEDDIWSWATSFLLLDKKQ